MDSQELATETATESSEPVKAHNLPLTGGNKRKKTGALTEVEPLNKRVDTLRYASSVLAQRLAEEIRSTLDSSLPKKERVRLVRELTWSYGVLLDKAAAGSNEGVIQIKFPAEVLQAMKVGIALQVAPKPITDPQVIVESTSLPS